MKSSSEKNEWRKSFLFFKLSYVAALAALRIRDGFISKDEPGYNRPREPKGPSHSPYMQVLLLQFLLYRVSVSQFSLIFTFACKIN